MNLLLLALGYVAIAVLSIWLLKLRDERRARKITITFIPAEGDTINGSSEPLTFDGNGKPSRPGGVWWR